MPPYTCTGEDNVAQTHRNSSQSSRIHIFTGVKNATFCVFQTTYQKVAAVSYASRTLLQTDKHASTPPLRFYGLDALLAAQPTASKH